VQVLHRQPLSRSASVAVITVGSRVLVVGTTDHQVSLLTELDPEELPGGDLAPGADLGADLDADLLTAPRRGPVLEPTAPVAARGLVGLASTPAATPAGGSHRATGTSRRTPTSGALAGSVISPQTWRQAIAAASGKAS
jgi:flagellar protein FliO/FliZ